MTLPPLFEWQAVTLGGALGGFASMLLPGADPPFGDLLEDALRGHKWWTLVVHWAANMVAGGLASFILWGGYTGETSFGSAKISPFEVGTALATGLGGIGVLRRLVFEGEKAHRWEESTKNLVEYVDEQQRSTLE